MLRSILLEVAESLLRNAKKIRFIGKRSQRTRHITRTLKRNGYWVKESFADSERCEIYRKKIDALLADPDVNVWSDPEGADQRVYFAEQVTDLFDDFFREEITRDTLKEYLGTEDPVGMIMVARIKNSPNNKGSGGGWHRDSPVRHQFKSFMYLNDVCSSNGPFQIIPKSHNKSAVFKTLLGKVFKPGQYRFSEQEIDLYENKFGERRIDLTGKQGTLAFADTKAIHRGKPLEAGERYIIFCYFWDKEIPSHFSSLMQKG